MTTAPQAPSASSTEPRGPFPDLDVCVAHLFDDVRAARATLTLYEASPDHHQRYAEEIRAVLDTMERDLTLARGELDAHEADTIADAERAVRDVATKTRAWLEEMRVRSNLGRMDVSDRIEVVNRRIEHVATEARRAMERVGDAVGSDMSEVRRIAEHALAEVRAALRDAAEAVRDPRH